MSGEVIQLSPEYIAARDTYQENLRKAFLQLGFTKRTLADIQRRGRTPFIECENYFSHPQGIDLKDTYSSALAELLGWNSPTTNLTFQRISLATEHLSVRGIHRYDKVRAPYLGLDFDIEKGIYYPHPIPIEWRGARQAPVTNETMGKIAELPEHIAQMDNTYASSRIVFPADHPKVTGTNIIARILAGHV